MYKEGLALNNLQWLICHKTPPNLTKRLVLRTTIWLLYYILSGQYSEAVEVGGKE